MNQIAALTPQQLRQAADLQEKILELKQELEGLLGASAEPAPTVKPAAAATSAKKRRPLSPQAIANIRAGVRKRQAKTRGDKVLVPAGLKPASKRKISAAGRRRLSELAKARWARAKATGRLSL